MVGTVSEAWERCLPIWRNSPWNDEDWAHGGRVNDYPFNLHRPSYWPSDETRLGYGFIEHFSEDYLFLLDRFTHGSPAEKLCAFDLLHFLAREFYATEKPLPTELRESQLPLPDWLRKDWEWAPLDLVDVLHEFTLGEFLTNVPPVE